MKRLSRGLSPWTPIGQVCLDTGCLALVDPCHADAVEIDPENYDVHDLHIESTEAPIGVILPTGMGDGFYTVEARFAEAGMAKGRIVEIRIQFLPPEWYRDVKEST